MKADKIKDPPQVTHTSGVGDILVLTCGCYIKFLIFLQLSLSPVAEGVYTFRNYPIMKLLNYNLITDLFPPTVVVVVFWVFLREMYYKFAIIYITAVIHFHHQAKCKNTIYDCKGQNQSNC